MNYDTNKITNYLKKYSKALPELYKWNVRLDSLVELGVISNSELKVVSTHTPYEKEIFLKERLELKLKKAYKSDHNLFDKLCLWIVKEWGGIRGANDQTTLKLVHQFLISHETEFHRIASISKVASFMFPKKYCIYDSRVAYTLNWIILSQNAGTRFFPIPEGRNSKMIAFNMDVLIRLFNVQNYTVNNISDLSERQFIKNRDKFLFIPKHEAYNHLNNLIKEVSLKLWEEDKSEYLYNTEMLLFSIADREIFQDITNTVNMIISPIITQNNQPKSMTIYEQINEYCKGKEGKIILSSVIKQELNSKFGTNPDSIIPSDYCYNRINDGIAFDKHLLEFLGDGQYRVLGEKYPYTGEIYHKSKKLKEEYVIGKWTNGDFVLFDIEWKNKI